MHLVSVNDLSSDFIDKVFLRYKKIKTKHQNRHIWPKGSQKWNELSQGARNRLLITDFFEPSTRTRLSFEAAMTYLGGNVIGTENAAEFSSIKKGESLSDNFRVISGYCDIIVGRFLNEGDARIAADASLVPVINGGDGKGEHPTQALIDLFSIMEKFTDVRNLRVTFLGDNKYSRTVQSLSRLLARFSYVNTMNFVGPEEVNFTLIDPFFGELQEISEGHHLAIRSFNELYPNITISQSDIVYVTRSQNERHYFEGTLDDNFVLTPEIANIMPENGLILHPLPRRSELPVEVDNNPRSYYFQQAHNGLFTRMALLEAMLYPERILSY